MTYLPGCTGKQRYIDRPAAKRSAARQRRFKGKKLHVYYCEFCGNWHLTSHMIPRAEARERNQELLSTMEKEST